MRLKTKHLNTEFIQTPSSRHFSRAPSFGQVTLHLQYFRLLKYRGHHIRPDFDSIYKIVKQVVSLPQEEGYIVPFHGHKLFRNRHVT